MPKRTYKEKMGHYIRKIHRRKRKLEKLKRKLNRNKHSHVEDSTSSVQNNQNNERCFSGEPTPDPEPLVPGPIEPLPEYPLEVDPIVIEYDIVPSEVAQVSVELDPEMLTALGQATDSGPTWGQEINTYLPRLWQPLLKKGMSKDAKKAILKQYPIPSNCKLLQAPKLNVEISAAVTKMARARDKRFEAAQQQLGIGITAVSRAMTLLMSGEDKIAVMKTLGEGCRLLCDLHHAESQARIKMISPGLAKPFLNVIQDIERDETLFGASLPDKIIALNTIEKQGRQIKKTAPANKHLSPAVGQNYSQTQQLAQENWVEPPCCLSTSLCPAPMNAGPEQSQANQGRPCATTST